uniref:Anamorsin homolog n=1 Tax=Tabanus bromius TaxID=304241 RepID=A0A0K8TQ88_TABBR
MDKIKEGDRALYIWESADPNGVERDVNQIKSILNVAVSVENVERLHLGVHEDSTYDVVVFTASTCESKFLSAVLKLLKPKGLLIFKNQSKTDNALLQMKLCGFLSCRQEGDFFLGEKPNYEVGSSLKLPFAIKEQKQKVAAVWKICDENDDVIEADELLGEEDSIKPSAGSLKVCSTTGKRKACKNCSCGLAEELKEESDANNVIPATKSSCGNCYLGDAFRCASCPYLGMPAFKLGEKVEIPTNLLKADL